MIGRLRVPRLIAAGDEAHGMTRSVSKRAMPWSGSDYAHQPAAAPHGPGAVRRLRYRKRRTVTIEPVVEMHAGRCLVYEVISGLPVRHYRATVELTPDRDGTDVEWSASFDRTFRGRLFRGTLQRVYEEVVNRLVAAEATSGAGAAHG